MKQVTKGLAYILAALILMWLFWLLFGQEARAQTQSADSAVVFFRCEPRRTPTQVQLDSLLDWAKSVYVKGGKFKVVGFASTRDHDRRDETFARNRKKAGKKVLANAGFAVLDGGIFGGPGFYRGLKVVFLRPTVDTTARRIAATASSKADAAVARATAQSRGKKWLATLGARYISTPATRQTAFATASLEFEVVEKLRFSVHGGIAKAYSDRQWPAGLGEIGIGYKDVITAKFSAVYISDRLTNDYIDRELSGKICTRVPLSGRLKLDFATSLNSRSRKGIEGLSKWHGGFDAGLVVVF